jgi:hypothetical protein
MFCPNCSQQEISSEMRFCSRCGFQLDFVRELIAGGGAFVEREFPGRAPLLKAFRGMRRGVWVMVASFFLLLLTGLITAIDDDFAILVLLPSLGFLVGFFISLYGAFVQGRRVKTDLLQSNPGSQPQLQWDTAARHQLFAMPPPVANLPVKKMQTAEMRQQPSSVTENTTRLLDDD